MALEIVERAVRALLDMTAMGLTVADMQEMLPEVQPNHVDHAANNLFQRWRVSRLVIRKANGKEVFVYFSNHLKISCPVTPQFKDDKDDPDMQRRVQEFLNPEGEMQ